MHRQVKDFDVATEALPGEVEKLFEKTVPIGRDFGVILVVGKSEGEGIEVTTFRKESEYNKRRQPTRVDFTDLQGDGSRRDFTINAIYYDPISNQLVDPFGGQEDIEGKVIRAIGDPKERLSEDPLRVLRALRFSAKFGFQLESCLKKSLKECVDLVGDLSKERVFDEFKKGLVGPDWILVACLYQEFNLWEKLGLVQPTDSLLHKIALLGLEGDIEQTLVWLWSDKERKFFEEILKSLKSSNLTKKTVLHDFDGFKKWQKENLRTGEKILLFRAANAHASSAHFFKTLQGLVKIYSETELEKDLVDHYELYQKISIDGKLPEALVDGAYLIQKGMKKGPQMGALIHELYLRQLEGKLNSLKDAEDQLTELLRTSNEV